MVATLIHLVRHGEVHNPDEVLYGRIPGFHLSELGHRMAVTAAGFLAGHPIRSLTASPLQRTQESAEPWSSSFGLPIVSDERVIEPTNRFEGSPSLGGVGLLMQPRQWPLVMNPFTPSWGEPYLAIALRMIAAIDDVYATCDTGEAVIVTHQLPIVMVQRSVARQHLWHDPRARRCSLSSITTIERITDAAAGTPRYRQVSYAEPAAALLAEAVDSGAV